MPGRLLISFLNINGKLKMNTQLMKSYSIKQKCLLDIQTKNHAHNLIVQLTGKSKKISELPNLP